MSEPVTKAVVIIGGFGHEGLDAHLKALGYELVSLKLDDVKPPTWLKRANRIEELRSSGRLAATIIYLHTSLLLNASKDGYRQAFFRILESARGSKAIIFAFQSNLDGNFFPRHWRDGVPMTLDELELWHEEMPEHWDLKRARLESAIARVRDYRARTDEVNALIGALYDSGAEIAPFFQRSDVTIRLQEFLGDIEQGVFLRLFIPTDRLQAEQLKSLLAVLERYLRQVEGQNFSIDSRKSDKGVVYIFRSELNIASLQTLEEAFGRFDSFMKLCGDDPTQAEAILTSKGLPAGDAAFSVEKYAREYRRLILDTKHEFERKSLILRQRLEAEVIESGVPPTLSWSQESLPSLLTATATGGNIAINIGTVSVVNADKIQTHVDQIVNGSVSYNGNDKLLLEVFSRYADRLEALQLRSDLDQLKDKSTPEPTRQTAKQRLVGFLRKAAYKGGELAEKVAVEVLSKYLETVFKGGL